MPLLTRTTACLALALLGCSPAAPALGEIEHYSEGFTQLQYVRPNKVDILIVLDNSSSMAEEQAILANNLGAFIDVLEAEEVEADYRVAITTTDAGQRRDPPSSRA
jgi:hypothetical protein